MQLLKESAFYVNVN